MKSRISLIKKKDKGIALIFSLFFFVMFFAFGTILLFRSTLSKKTSNAMTNAQLSSASVEGAIGEVRANLVMANLNIDGSRKSSGTSLAFEDKMALSTLSNDRSPVYTLSSQSSTSVNGSANNIVSKSTPELFRFNFNGIELANGIDSSLTGAPNPEWNIHYSDPSKTAGTGAIRFSYIVLDQTGKINPNFSSSSVYDPTAEAVRQGFDSEIFKRASEPKSTTASGIYDLSGLFTTIAERDEAATSFTLNRFNSLSQLSDIIQNGPPSQLSGFDTNSGIGVLDETGNEIEMSSERLALENFYPYSHPVTYAEKKNIFNLAYLDSATFKSYSHEQKVEEIVGETESDPEESFSASGTPGIPYLAYMPSLEYDPNNKNQIPAQKEQVAASLIDMVDDDLFSTNNYGVYEAGDPYDSNSDGQIGSGETVPAHLIGKPWSWLTWLEKTNKRPYSGFEGLYVTQINFHNQEQARNAHLTDRVYHNDGQERTRLRIRAELSCAYDLNGETLTSVMTRTHPNLIDSNGRLRLLHYVRYKVSCKYWEQETRGDAASPWTKPYKNLKAGTDDFDDNPHDGQTGLNYGAETTLDNHIIEAVGYAPTVRNLGRCDYPRGTGSNKRSNRSYYLAYVPEKDYNTFEQRDGNKATSAGSEHWDNWSGCLTSYYKGSIGSKNDEGRLGVVNYEADYQPSISHIEVKLDSPIITFIDREDTGRTFDNIPQADEIVCITTPEVPDQSDDLHKGYSGVALDRGLAPQGLLDLAALETYNENLVIDGRSTDGNNRDVLTAIVTGDPRLGHLPQSGLTLQNIATINITNGAGGAIETAGKSPWIFIGNANHYNYNQIEQIHNQLDHFETWSLDNLHPRRQAPFINDFRFPTKEELMFTFPKMDNEVILNKSIVDYKSSPQSGYADLSVLTAAALDLNNYQPNREIGQPWDVNNTGIDRSGFKSISSFALPLKYDTNGAINGFGGLEQVADIGKVCRGEHWRTLNLCQYNTKLVEVTEDYESGTASLSDVEKQYVYAGVKASSYKGDKNADGSFRSDYGFDSSKQTSLPSGGNGDMLFPYNRYDISSSETVDDLITDYAEGAKVGGLLQGGDAAILDQVSFDDSQSNTRLLDLNKKTIYGVYNPNTTYPLSFQSMVSGIKINRRWFASKSYRKGDIEAPENPALPVWKSAALTSNFYKLIKNNLADTNNNKAPFDRKYAYSNTLGKSPGDVSYEEGFNISSEYDPITRSYMNGELRTGSFRWGNVFANDKNYFLVDSEREALYTNTREFISTRYNYYSTILLVESLKMVPDSASGDEIVPINSSGDKAKIEAHYRVRAELVHDILTNQVKIMNYSILN